MLKMDRPNYQCLYILQYRKLTIIIWKFISSFNLTRGIMIYHLKGEELLEIINKFFFFYLCILLLLSLGNNIICNYNYHQYFLFNYLNIRCKYLDYHKKRISKDILKYISLYSTQAFFLQIRVKVIALFTDTFINFQS